MEDVKDWKPVSKYFSNLIPEWYEWLVKYLKMEESKRAVEVAQITMKIESILIQLEDANRAVILHKAKRIDENWRLGAISALRFNQGCVKLVENLNNFDLSDKELSERVFVELKKVENDL